MATTASVPPSERAARADGAEPKARRSVTETRRKLVVGDALLQLVVLGVEAHGALEEDLFVLGVARVRQAALDRAHGLASFLVVETDALGAQLLGSMR